MSRELFNWDSGKSEGVTDHGELEGLGDDDHSQYLNEARHDKTERHGIGEVVPHDTTKVGLSGNETIAGVKTFSSIPVLPASDPTTDNQAVRKAYVDGLSLGKILAVKFVDFGGTQATSVASGGTLNITDLTITHTLSASSNKILLLGQVGMLSDSDNFGSPTPNFTVDGTAVGIGAASGARTRTSAAFSYGEAVANQGRSAFIQHLYSPGDVSSHTYRLQVINLLGNTSTVYINRTQNDSDHIYRPRAISSLTLLEVAG